MLPEAGLQSVAGPGLIADCGISEATLGHAK